MFKYDELTEVVRKSDQVFVNLLNNVRFATVDENTGKLLKARLIDQSDKNYPHDALHMYVENAPTTLTNQTVLNNLPGEVYSIKADDKISDSSKTK